MSIENMNEVTLQVSGYKTNELVSGLKAVAINILNLLLNKNGEGSATLFGLNDKALGDLQFEEVNETKEYLDFKIKDISENIFPNLNISGIEIETEDGIGGQIVYVAITIDQLIEIEEGFKERFNAKRNEIIFKMNDNKDENKFNVSIYV